MADEAQGVELRGQRVEGALDLVAPRRPAQAEDREVVRLLDVPVLGVQAANVQLRGGRRARAGCLAAVDQVEEEPHAQNPRGDVLAEAALQQQALNRALAV